MSSIAALFMGFFLICFARLMPAADNAGEPDATALRDAKAASAEFYFRGQAGRIAERLAAERFRGCPRWRRTGRWRRRRESRRCFATGSGWV